MQEFFQFLVAAFRQHDPHMNVEIAAPISFQREAFFFQAQHAIRNVVSALNFTEWGKKPVPWANPDTGSQGTITTIAENSKNNQLCREFETSREAFDGVSIYRGETCMQRGGQWTVTSFAPI